MESKDEEIKVMQGEMRQLAIEGAGGRYTPGANSNLTKMVQVITIPNVLSTA